MFFRRKKIEKDKEEIRQAMSEFVRDLIYEIVAQNQMGVKASFFTVDEFQEMTNDFVDEAETFYDDMDVDEILDERRASTLKKAAEASDNVKVIKVEL